MRFGGQAEYRDFGFQNNTNLIDTPKFTHVVYILFYFFC